MDSYLMERAINLINGFWSQIEDHESLSYHFICGFNSSKLLLAIKEPNLKYERIECSFQEIEENDRGMYLVLKSYNEIFKVKAHSETQIAIQRGDKEFIALQR